MAYVLILYQFQYMSAKSKLYLTTFGGHIKFAKVKIVCISKFYQTFANILQVMW